jgi:ATP/maltotriose-dependent transcriptional regulator MalT
MLRLLTALARRAPTSRAARRLLAAATAEEARERVEPTSSFPASALTTRELEILRLLTALAKRTPTNSAAVRLLAAATAGRAVARVDPTSSLAASTLTTRELEILRLLASDLSGPEISRHLTLSLNTVRTHIKNIYLKLDANSRRAAVRRAAELGILH